MGSWGGSRLVHPSRGGAAGPSPHRDDDEELLAVDMPALEVAHAAARPHEAGPEALLGLNRLAGNAAVSRLVAGPSAPVVQRDTWGRDYRTRRARPDALSYEAYKAAIGQSGSAESYAPPLKNASEWGGHRVDPVKLTYKELSAILLPEQPGDPKAVEAHEDRLVDNLQHINTAFEAMGIDTVEAQSDYLAHAAGESGTLAKLSEVIDTEHGYGEFYGRGPVHVTWESGYVQTLAYLEERAEAMDRQVAERPPAAAESDPDFGAPSRQDEETAELARQAALAHEAVAAIKADPDAAANPKYAFLFSAAYMHWTRGVKRSGSIGGAKPGAEMPATSAAFTGAGPEDQWMTGQATPWPATGGGRDMTSVRSRAKVKKETYERGVAVLSPKIVRKAEENEAGETTL